MDEHKEQKRASNVRLGLVLLSIVLAFFVGFVAKMVLLGR